MARKILKLMLFLAFIGTLNLYLFKSYQENPEDYLSSVIQVSVIIPVYNSQEYIEKAISSLLDQTLKKIEFIFVDDKSPDNSSEIIERYVATDRRFRLIRNEKNLGPGMSRNVGIEAAYGEYVGFLDPDDWVNPDFFEALYERATETIRGSYDIAKGQLVRVKNRTMKYEPNEWWKDINKGRQIHEVFTWQHYTAIFKKSILDDHPDARYGSNNFGEDAIFLMKTCYYSNNITFTNIAKYFYFMRSGSLSTRAQHILLYNTYHYLKEIDDFLLAVEDVRALKFIRSDSAKRLGKMLNETVKSEGVNEENIGIYKDVSDFIEKLKEPLK